MPLRHGFKIVADPLGPPRQIMLENLAYSFEATRYARAVANSLAFTLSATLLVSFLGALAACPLARRAGLLSLAVIVLMALATPAFPTIPPAYVLFTAAALFNTQLDIVLAFTALNLSHGVSFQASVITTTLRELDQAARLNGRTAFQTFWRSCARALGRRRRRWRSS